MPKQRKVTAQVSTRATPSSSSSSSASTSAKAQQPLQQQQTESDYAIPRPPRSARPIQPPLNPKFERPNTRASSASDAGSDIPDPEDAGSPFQASSEQVVEVPNAGHETHDKGARSLTENAATTPQEQNITNTAGKPLVQMDDEQDLEDTQPLESTSAAVVTGASARIPSSPQEPIKDVTVDTAADETDNIPQLEDTAKVTDTATTPKTVENSIPIPAQIAVVAASPSKRVAFSPNKQESVLSVPGKAVKALSTLRGILKPTPFRLDDHATATEATQNNTNINSNTLASSSSTTNSGDPKMETPAALEAFAKKTIAELASPDPQVRTTAYSSLQATFRVCPENMQLSAVKKSLKGFVACNQRDIDLSNPSALVQAALKCLGYYFFQPGICAMFTNQELETYLTKILSIIDTTTDKATCNLAVWILSTTRIQPKIMAPFIPQMIQAFSQNLDSRFKSLSIMSECLVGLFVCFHNHPTEILPNVQHWLIPLISRLVHAIPGIRSKALETIIVATPKLIEKDDAKRQQAVNKFLTEHCEGFFAVLKQNFLDAGEEVYAITVWGCLVTVIGKALHRTSQFNPLLKMAEKCFNTSSSRRAEIKMAAFQAWTRLIYNFAIGGHIAQEKPLRLMLTPITNCFMNEKIKRVRLACTNAWIALIYALGSKLPKFAGQVLFPLLKVALKDESDHVRDVVLRFLNALFSNTGGQELVEGRYSIVPGSITFELGLSDVVWVRTELLDHGLESVLATIMFQNKNVHRDEWRRIDMDVMIVMQLSDHLTSSMVGLKPTAEAERAISSLVYFIEKVSQCDASTLVLDNWPPADHKGVNLLRVNPEKAGYIMRADIAHYLYNCMIEVFSVRSLVATRYKIRDKLNADLNKIFRVSPTVSQTSEVDTTDAMLSPLEFILKTWLVTGESVLGTPYETSFWQAVSSLVDMSKAGLRALSALYQCLGHMYDIKRKRLTEDASIWIPPNKPIDSLIFREFQCKYWSIIAQRLGTTIHEINEISEDAAPDDERGYQELFRLLLYPFEALRDPNKPDSDECLESSEPMDHSQRLQESQDRDVMATRTAFVVKYKNICLPTWTDLVRVFYKVAQHKRGNANIAMNTLAGRIRQWSDPDVPFVWMQSLSVACASVLVETIVLFSGTALNQSARGNSVKQNVDELLRLCSQLFEHAYTNLQLTESLDNPGISTVLEDTFLLMEKIINKAPLSLIMPWLHQLQRSIMIWMNDSDNLIQSFPKALRRPLQQRVDDFWNGCVLTQLVTCSTDPTFGSVIAPHLPTVRGALHHALGLASAGSSIASSARSSPHPMSPTDKNANPFNSQTLAFLESFIVAGLGSEQKGVVNKTLEFWNQTFGTADENLQYPEGVVAVLRPLKLVATIRLPGWSHEDDSQIPIPQFASMSQEMLSLPAELNVKSPLSIHLKRKAELATEATSKNQKRKSSSASESRSTAPSPAAATAASVAITTAGPTAIGGHLEVDPIANRDISRGSSPNFDSDSSVQSSSTESKNARKKRRRRAEKAALENLRRLGTGPTATTASSSVNSTPETSVEQQQIDKEIGPPPAKKSRMVLKVKTEEMPPAPLFKRGPPMQPYDPATDTGVSPSMARDPDELGSSLSPASSVSDSASPPPRIIDAGNLGEQNTGTAVDSPKYITQETAIQKGAGQQMVDRSSRKHPTNGKVGTSEEPPRRTNEPIEVLEVSTKVTETESMATATAVAISSPIEDVSTTADPTTRVSTTAATNGGVEGGDGSTPLQQQTLSAAYFTPRSEISPNYSPTGTGTEPVSPNADVNTRSADTLPISTGEEFRDAVTRLVKSRELVANMQMRHLLELQTQLNTLSQVVCSAWGLLVKNDGSSSDESALRNKDQQQDKDASATDQPSQ
ncbi:DNA-binding protein rif1 [Gryganskiella cystojenkinii]|nr:DNA-binding protein rif1 [Gryganskiella cystojenkinii]